MSLLFTEISTKYVEHFSLSRSISSSQNFFHIFIPSFLFYPTTITQFYSTTSSKLLNKAPFLFNDCSRYHTRATIDVYFHRFTCRFKSLLMYIGTDKSICIRVLLLKFPIQFPHTLFDVKSFILFLW